LDFEFCMLNFGCIRLYCIKYIMSDVIKQWVTFIQAKIPHSTYKIQNSTLLIHHSPLTIHHPAIKCKNAEPKLCA
jgi:hypothetical protein